jgi:hypothetical protein
MFINSLPEDIGSSACGRKKIPVKLVADGESKVLVPVKGYFTKELRY